jgi:hypothetical protein
MMEFTHQIGEGDWHRDTGTDFVLRDVKTV